MTCFICEHKDLKENEEIKICNNCYNFLKNLKCSFCKNSISYKSQSYCLRCNNCLSKEEKTELEKLKKKEKEIQRANIENEVLINKPIYDNKKFIDFYDIILKINSIRDVLNGWNIEFSEKGKDYYEKMKIKNFLKIGVAGVGNKGKSFLLQKLANIELPTGTSIKTEGLSIRCPDIDSENQSIILLDSARSEAPLIEDSNFDFNKYIGNPKELKEQLHNLKIDKSLTETFLQNIIINESNMLLILVGDLTYQEQKLINKIKEESQNKNQSLYVIHNLQTFVERSQVENYIQNTLLKSATFRLKKNKEIIINKEDEISEENDSYYIELPFPNESDNFKNVYHLIMAREKTPAGDYYNKFVIKFLRNQMNNFPQQTPFPIVKKIKDYFFNQSKYYLDNPLQIDSFEESEDVIKVKKDTDLRLKKIIVDEMGISNFIGNSYSPKYCYFIYQNRFYFQIELPGKFDKKQFKYNIYVKEKYYIIDIKAFKSIGTKEFFPKEKGERKFFNSREEGPFQIRLTVLAEDFEFKEQKIVMVKPQKKVNETQKNNDKNAKKETKKTESEKTSIGLEDVKSEEGVLTFYVELQETKVEEKGLSDSEDIYFDTTV